MVSERQISLWPNKRNSQQTGYYRPQRQQGGCFRVFSFCKGGSIPYHRESWREYGLRLKRFHCLVFWFKSLLGFFIEPEWEKRFAPQIIHFKGTPHWAFMSNASMTSALSNLNWCQNEERHETFWGSKGYLWIWKLLTFWETTKLFLAKPLINNKL